MFFPLIDPHVQAAVDSRGVHKAQTPGGWSLHLDLVDTGKSETVSPIAHVERRMSRLTPHRYANPDRRRQSDCRWTTHQPKQQHFPKTT